MMARRSNKAAPGARETVPARELRLRLYAGAHIAMGPGKADLLEAIMRCGSISAAGRELGISYKRCWDMVETMNAHLALGLAAPQLGVPYRIIAIPAQPNIVTFNPYIVDRSG